MLQVDLHCHSNVSDGLLAPAALARRAVANGVEMLALTDHDDVGGLADARTEAASIGLRFVDGVEISVSFEDITLHVVGLGIDPRAEVLAKGLADIRSGRRTRAEGMAAALAAVGIAGALQGAAAFAHNPRLISRTHFARFLVQLGASPDVNSVFDHYLVRGKPGYFAHRWASMEDALAWIAGAGGVSVLAHPSRYRVGRTKMERILSAFRDCGGVAIEVVSGTHAPDKLRELARLARRYGFEASRGSDFHGPGESRTDIGCSQLLPDGLTPVWQRFL